MLNDVRIEEPLIKNSTADDEPEWKTGLLDIHEDIGFCCLATICPCAAYGLNYALMTEDDGIGSCILPCMCFALLEMASPILTAAYAGNCSKTGNQDFGSPSSCACLLLQQQIALNDYITKRKDSGVCSLACEVCVCAPCAQTRLRNEFIYRKSKNKSLAFKPLHGCIDWGWAGCVE